MHPLNPSIVGGVSYNASPKRSKGVQNLMGMQNMMLHRYCHRGGFNEAELYSLAISGRILPLTIWSPQMTCNAGLIRLIPSCYCWQKTGHPSKILNNGTNWQGYNYWANSAELILKGLQFMSKEGIIYLKMMHLCQ